MHAIRIDRTKSLTEQPQCGHNRYHPDIAPAISVQEGEEVALETRDALDGQIKPHPLTGPVFPVVFGLLASPAVGPILR